VAAEYGQRGTLDSFAAVNLFAIGAPARLPAANPFTGCEGMMTVWRRH